jgi:gamma-glutamyltranspeptidase/glutathione hydrolase
MLALLEGYDLKSLGHNSGEYLHLLIEAKKIAFADRDYYLADRRFMKVRLEDLLAPERIKRLRIRIRADRASAEVHQDPVHSGTEYLAVVDAAGNAVSYIESLFMSFGSGVVVEDTGVILQNRGHLFSLDPDHPNCIGPQKRCIHTLMPGMLLKDGRPYLVLGLKGGHVQPQVQAQIICALLDCGRSIQETISAPRFNHLNRLEVGLEPGFAQEVLMHLSDKGHKIVDAPAESYGGAHAILVDPDSGVLMGGSDPRKDGAAVGF